MPDGGALIPDGGTSISDDMPPDKICPKISSLLSKASIPDGGLGVPDGGLAVPGPFFFSSRPFCWASFSDSLA